MEKSKNSKIVQNDVTFTDIGWRQIDIFKYCLNVRLRLTIWTFMHGSRLVITQGQGHELVYDLGLNFQPVTLIWLFNGICECVSESFECPGHLHPVSHNKSAHNQNSDQNWG